MIEGCDQGRRARNIRCEGRHGGSTLCPAAPSPWPRTSRPPSCGTVVARRGSETGWMPTASMMTIVRLQRIRRPASGARSKLLDPAAERFELPLEGGDRLGLRRIGFLGPVEVDDHELEPLEARAHLADQVLARLCHRTGVLCSG